jgi:A/G-specific adenine glycosylase
MNQALMELGSRICVPVEPKCADCPIQRECRAFAEGRQAQIPFRPEPVPITDVTEASIAVRRGNAYLLRQRPQGERWAGLWDFPRFELSENETASQTSKRNGLLLKPGTEQRLAGDIRVLTGVQADLGAIVTEIRHTVTRYRIHLLSLEGRYVAGQPSEPESIRWVSRKDFADYPLSTTGRKVADLLAGRE